MRLETKVLEVDKERGGRCSECRTMHDSLVHCLVCGQVLCDKCAPQGSHEACYADTMCNGRSHGLWKDALAKKTEELDNSGLIGPKFDKPDNDEGWMVRSAE